MVAKYFKIVIVNQYLTLRLMSLRSISPCVGGLNPPPGTIFKFNINDLIFRDKRYACVFQKHTKHTLFCVFVGLDYGLNHCVLTLFDEQRLLRSSDRFKFKVFYK